MSDSGSKWSKLAGAVIFADQLLGQIPDGGGSNTPQQPVVSARKVDLSY